MQKFKMLSKSQFMITIPAKNGIKNSDNIFLYISIVHGNNISNNSRHLILYLAVNEDERMTTLARKRYFDHLEYLLISS